MQDSKMSSWVDLLRSHYKLGMTNYELRIGSWELRITIGVNLRLKPLRNLVFTLSLDPPKSPLRRGTLIGILSHTPYSPTPLIKGG